MPETNKIYIDIQSLLEVRQSVLIDMLGQEKAINYVNNKEYFLREVDVHKDVDMDAFEQALKDPAVSLKHATVTYLVSVLTNRLSQMEKINTFKNEDCATELVVNIHPYNLPDEVVDKLRTGLFIKLQIPVLITIVNEPLSVWSPSFIKHSGVSQFYCYYGSEWLGMYTTQITSGSIRDVRLFFPALGKRHLSKVDIKEIQKAGFKDIFAYTEFIFSPYTKIQFLPSVFYSNLITAVKVLADFDEELRRSPPVLDEEVQEQETKE